MHLVALLLLLLGLTISSPAEPIRPFVGGSFGILETSDQYFAGNHFTEVELPTHNGSDFQIELGVTNDTYAGYVAYRGATSSWDEGQTHDYYVRGFYVGSNDVRTSDLTSEHFLIGGRAQLKLGLPEIIRPVVGAGLSWGHVDRDLVYTPYNFGSAIEGNNEERSVTYESEDGYGGLFEIGLALRPKIPFQFFLTFQLHAYDAEFEAMLPSPNADQHEVRDHSIALGIIYNFKTLGELE
jgi:hypothetical protein